MASIVRRKPTPAQLMRQHFSVINATPRLQAGAWNDYVSRPLGVRIPRHHRTHGFHGELDTSRIRQCLGFRARYAAHMA